ncbi:MAG: hypothetical protein NW220_02855 [Leptolyngbyaceae cyanobacterium bins.349]|nr:hypothetical protein [Leptolyngbyaceae cyanobacterium bins.349]
MSNSAQAIADRNYSLEIGEYFSRGWDLFKQYALPFVGYLLLTALIGIVASRLPAPLGANEEGRGGIVNGVLSPILSAGFYIVAFKLAKNQIPSFGDFFRGFNNFLQIFLVGLVGGLLIALGLILLILPGIYLIVAYFFATPLVVEKRFDFWTALETSRKLVSKRWFSFLGFGLLLLLLNLGGALLFGVGLLVTVPWTFCTIVAAYEDIVGLNGSGPDAPMLDEGV